MESSKTVCIEKVSPGARLAVDIVDPKGMRLLSRGTVLTEAQLEVLRRKGVKLIGIALPASLDPERREEERGAATARLARLFRSAGVMRPVMQALHDTLLAYRLERLEAAYRGDPDEGG